MASIDLLRASDGSGDANIATVQSTRAPAATTIEVDTVAGINDTFMGSMGTPHTFTDPVTSETITIISEATRVDFAGHVDGANLEIDTIAPGQSDLGSEIGDIVIIRPTTQWADELADVLSEIHEDDGTLKPEVVGLANFEAEVFLGWYDTDESWSYAGWTAGTRIGTITVPTDATNKYTAGMRIRISQSTGGTKYGIIHKVEATTLHVFFPDGTTLNNEAISSPFYSIVKVPFGFDADPSKWTIQAAGGSRSTTSTTITSLTDTLAHGPGAWHVSIQFEGEIELGGNLDRYGYVGLSSDGGVTETDAELMGVITGIGTTSALNSFGGNTVFKDVIKTAATTWTMAGRVSGSSTTMNVHSGAVLRATSNYL